MLKKCKMKRALIFITAIFLLISIVKAQNLPVGANCLNNDECLSEVCQGGKCRSEDIRVLINETQKELDEFVSEEESCIENWRCGSWTACVAGTRTRICTDLNNCNNAVEIIQKPVETESCTSSAQASCTDGIKNQNEEGVDCGGPCSPCSSCYDSEQNCHGGLCEEGIDCGGSCTPCEVQETGSSRVFWISFTSILLIIIIVIIGLLYWKLKGEAKEIGKEEKKWEHHKRPPIQPSSLLRI